MLARGSLSNQIKHCFQVDDWVDKLETLSSQQNLSEYTGLIAQALVSTHEVMAKDLVHPITQKICRLFEALKKYNQIDIFKDIIAHENVRSCLPALFKKNKNDPSEFVADSSRFIHYILNSVKDFDKYLNKDEYHKVSKKDTGLPWSIVIFDKGFYVKGDVLGNGYGKKIRLLYPLSANGEELAETHWNKEFGATQDQYQQALKKDLEVSSYLIGKGVPYILKIQTVSYKGLSRNVMELCDQGTLASYLLKMARRLSLVQRMELALKITSALVKMAQLHIVHMDVCYKNIMIKNDNEVRIGDFEHSIDMTKDYFLQGLCSTFPSPEMVDAHHTDKELKVSSAIDAWGLADILHFLKYNKPLFLRFGLTSEAAENEKKQMRPSYSENLQEMLNFLNSTLALSNDLIDVTICKLLTVNPKNRLTMNDAYENISSWIKIQ